MAAYVSHQSSGEYQRCIGQKSNEADRHLSRLLVLLNEQLCCLARVPERWLEAVIDALETTDVWLYLYDANATLQFAGSCGPGTDPTHNNLLLNTGASELAAKVASTDAREPTSTALLHAQMLRAGEQAIGVLVFRKTERVEINLHQLRAVTAALGLTFAAWMARQTVRLHEEATAIVAHDLRSPVTSMLLQIEILRAAVELGKMPSSSTLDRLSKSGSRLARMTEDLMDSTRIELSRVRLDKLLLDPVECIQNLVEHILPTLGEREVLVRLLQRPSPTMLDPIRFDQILTNIIENAAKYSPAGTPIRLEVRAEAGGVEIKVHDTGMGILPDEIPRLFDRFYQAKRIRDGKTGLGLGLYITKGLIQAHGGTIAVASAPNRGTTVRIWLPGTAASEVHTTIAANPLAPVSK